MNNTIFECPDCGEDCYYNRDNSCYECDNCNMAYDGQELDYFDDLQVEDEIEAVVIN